MKLHGKGRLPGFTEDFSKALKHQIVFILKSFRTAGNLERFRTLKSENGVERKCQAEDVKTRAEIRSGGGSTHGDLHETARDGKNRDEAAAKGLHAARPLPMICTASELGGCGKHAFRRLINVIDRVDAHGLRAKC